MKIAEITGNTAAAFIQTARTQLAKSGLSRRVDVGLIPIGDNEVEIRILEVRNGEFGRGLGTKVMQILSSLADRLGVTLSLFPRSSHDYDDDPRYATAMGQEALENWYQKHGFNYLPNTPEQYQETGLEYGEDMVRPPQRK